MELEQVITVIGQVGVPVGLIAWGVWFISVKVWPWYTDPTRRAADREVEQGKSLALGALARAIEALAETLKPPEQVPPD